MKKTPEPTTQPPSMEALLARLKREQQLAADLRAEQAEEESLRNQLKKSRDVIDGLHEALAALAEGPVQEEMTFEVQP